MRNQVRAGGGGEAPCPGEGFGCFFGDDVTSRTTNFGGVATGDVESNEFVRDVVALLAGGVPQGVPHTVDALLAQHLQEAGRCRNSLTLL